MSDSLSEKSMSDYVPCCLSTHTISIKNVVPDSGAYVVRCSLRLRLFTVLFALVATRHFGVLVKGGLGYWMFGGSELGWDGSSGESRFKCNQRGGSRMKIARIRCSANPPWGRSGARKQRFVEGLDRPSIELRQRCAQTCLSV
jgi:hypothetical protein